MPEVVARVGVDVDPVDVTDPAPLPAWPLLVAGPLAVLADRPLGGA